MKVDSNIVSAIETYLSENHVGYLAFSQRLGVSPAAITKWRKVGSGITQTRWKELFPLIRKYLPKDRIYLDDAGKEQYSSNSAKQSAYFFEPKYIPMMVPAVTLEQLSEYSDVLESVTQFGARVKAPMLEYRPKHANKSGVLAVKINTNDMAPILPKGTTLFVCTGERPSDAGLVVAMPVGGKPIIGRYTRDGERFSIQEIGTQKPSGKGISGKIKDARSTITWAFPVLYYEVITF